MNSVQKINFAFFVLCLGFGLLIFISMSAMFIGIKNVSASIACGVDCWQDGADCKYDDTAFSNLMGCLINSPPKEDNVSGGSTCSKGLGYGSQWCGQGKCNPGAKDIIALNGAKCEIWDSSWDIVMCKEPFLLNTGIWDPSDGKCISCAANKTESSVYADTTTIGGLSSDNMCEFACGADFDCDEKSDNSFIGASCTRCDASDTGTHCREYCGKDFDCDYDKVCNTVCGSNAGCNLKKPGEACTGGICDSDCACVSSCNNNNTISSPEQCDGTDLGGNTCLSQGFAGGTLACNTDCTFDTSGCNDCSLTPNAVCPLGCTIANDADCGKYNCNNGSTPNALDCDIVPPSPPVDAGDCSSFDGTSCGGLNKWSCSGNCDDPDYDNASAKCSTTTNSPQLACGCKCLPPAIPPPCVPSGPENCAVAGDENCDKVESCADPGCGEGVTCNGAGDFCSGGACVKCTSSNLKNCNPGEICELGKCSACKGEGVIANGLSSCCPGLNWMDGVCTSKCDPRTSNYCNPLRRTISDIVQGGEKLISYVLGLIGSIALLFIVIAGMMYMTSAGSEARIESAKNILKGAVIGMAIALLAYGFLQIILNVLNM